MLRDREKRVVVVGGAAAACILVLTFVVLPAISGLRANARAAAAAEKDLAEVRRAKPELERAQRDTRQKAALAQAAANAKEASLSRLSAAIQEAGIPQAAFSVKSGGVKDGEFFREESFDVRMENMTYLESVKVLQRLSAGTLPLVVRTAQLKSRYEDPRYLDVTLRVGFLSPKQ